MEGSEGRGRSNKVLALVVVLGVGAGLAASLMKGTDRPQVSPTGGISMPAPKTDAPLPSPEELRADLLERLVAGAREGGPRRLPWYESFAIPCRRGTTACNATIDRLVQDDVPQSLRLAMARELQPRSAAAMDRLLLPLMEDPEGSAAAVEIYRNSGRALVASSAACGCGFGVVPAPLGERVWLFAAAAGAKGLRWEPQQDEQGWTLELARDPEGPTLLLQAVDVPSGSWRILSQEGDVSMPVPSADDACDSVPVAGSDDPRPPR